MAVRDYTFECCWLLLLALFAIGSRPARAQEVLNWNDHASDCDSCQTDGNDYCFCPFSTE